MESDRTKKKNSAASSLPNKTQYCCHKPCHGSSLIVGSCQDICSALWARGTYRAFSELLHENCGLSSHNNSGIRLLLLLVTTSLWVPNGLRVIISRVSCNVYEITKNMASCVTCKFSLKNICFFYIFTSCYIICRKVWKKRNMKILLGVYWSQLNCLNFCVFHMVV